MDVNKISMYVVQPGNKVQDVESHAPLEQRKENAVISDRVEFSNGTQEILLVKRAMAEGNEIRTGEVERFKKMLEDKTYKIDPDRLAEKMLDAYLPK